MERTEDRLLAVPLMLPTREDARFLAGTHLATVFSPCLLVFVNSNGPFGRAEAVQTLPSSVTIRFLARKAASTLRSVKDSSLVMILSMPWPDASSL